MLALAAFLIVAQAAPADASPDGALLDAFRAACARVDDLDHMIADARASGWQQVEESAHPQIERLNRFGRESVGAEGTGSGANFRRTLGGRELFLVVSRWVDGQGMWGNGCRLYHFDAAARIDPAALERWMGRPPTGTLDLPDAGIRLLWEPGWRDGVTLEINHVPGDSPLRERYGLSGNILVAQAIGGF
jgi:hypothetical protein